VVKVVTDEETAAACGVLFTSRKEWVITSRKDIP
jgi:hypothetical protein